MKHKITSLNPINILFAKKNIEVVKHEKKNNYVDVIWFLRYISSYVGVNFLQYLNIVVVINQ